METNERRAQVLLALQNAAKPISASTLAEQFEVSRQIIVGDIALLRAGGSNILATARGYLLQEAADGSSDGYVIACCHDKGGLSTELYCIVDNGATIENVSIDHPIYGSVSIPLSLKSRYDVDAYLKKVAVGNANLLCSLTDGVHLHTVNCPDSEAYRRILMALREKGILYIK